MSDCTLFSARLDNITEFFPKDSYQYCTTICIQELEFQSKSKNEKSDKKRTPAFRTKKWPQVVAAFAAQMGAFIIGAGLLWTATAIPDLVRSGELGEINKSDRSWMISATILGSLFTCPFTGFCLSHFGRQKTLIWSFIPIIVAWTIVSFSKAIITIHIGLGIFGGAATLCGQIGPLFIAESVEYEIRGLLMCMFEFSVCVGTVFIYIVGTYTTWRTQAVVCGTIPIFGFILFYFIPESPYFLIEKGKEKEAMEALCWFRGASSSDQVTDELKLIVHTIQSKTKDKDNTGWSALREYSTIKPIVISMAIMTFYRISYYNVIFATAVEIFQSAGSYDEYFSTVLLGLTQVVATAILLLIVDKFGRRVFLMTSFGMVICSMICLGLYFHLKANYSKLQMDDFNWIPLASFIVYVVSCSIGVVPLSWVISAEITPAKAKGLATSIVSVWQAFIGFVVFFTFWDLMEILGQDGIYWFIAGINIVAFIFIYFYLPETKGKSLEEIQLCFQTSETTRF